MYVCALGGGTEGITRVVGIERIKVPRSRAGSGRVRLVRDGDPETRDEEGGGLVFVREPKRAT